MNDNPGILAPSARLISQEIDDNVYNARWHALIEILHANVFAKLFADDPISAHALSYQFVRDWATIYYQMAQIGDGGEYNQKLRHEQYDREIEAAMQISREFGEDVSERYYPPNSMMITIKNPEAYNSSIAIIEVMVMILIRLMHEPNHALWRDMAMGEEQRKKILCGLFMLVNQYYDDKTMFMNDYAFIFKGTCLGTMSLEEIRQSYDDAIWEYQLLDALSVSDDEFALFNEWQRYFAEGANYLPAAFSGSLSVLDPLTWAAACQPRQEEFVLTPFNANSHQLEEMLMKTSIGGSEHLFALRSLRWMPRSTIDKYELEWKKEINSLVKIAEQKSFFILAWAALQNEGKYWQSLIERVDKTLTHRRRAPLLSHHFYNFKNAIFKYPFAREHCKLGIDRFLKENVDISSHEPGGRSLLYLSARAEKVAIVEHLLLSGVRVLAHELASLQAEQPCSTLQLIENQFALQVVPAFNDGAQNSYASEMAALAGQFGILNFNADLKRKRKCEVVEVAEEEQARSRLCSN